MEEHRRPDSDPDDTDAGYRDTLEEKAYEDAAAPPEKDAQPDDADAQRDEA